MATKTLRYRVNIKELPRKLVRFRSEIAQRIKRSPARMAEAFASTGHFIRTGKMKMQEDIFGYANETGVVADIHPDDLIFRFVVKCPGFKTNKEAIQYYFHDGANSAKKLSNLLFSELGLKRTVDTSLLEFASGYGCVTRHLTNQLTPLNIVSCDIHEAACAFIEGVIGVKTILSATKPEDLGVESDAFDVVFSLSFFSHMPDRTWGRWLKILYDKVRPGGYLIFTTHGMTTWVNNGKPAMPDDGIWFAPSSEQKDLDVADYGCAIVTPEYVRRVVSDVLHQDVLRMIEADWWGHQDLYVVKKLA
jgi:SAM-dependent methyltransferase